MLSAKLATLIINMHVNQLHGHVDIYHSTQPTQYSYS